MASSVKYEATRFGSWVSTADFHWSRTLRRSSVLVMVFSLAGLGWVEEVRGVVGIGAQTPK
jgi:hypothetical protein